MSAPSESNDFLVKSWHTGGDKAEPSRQAMSDKLQFWLSFRFCCCNLNFIRRDLQRTICDYTNTLYCQRSGSNLVNRSVMNRGPNSVALMDARLSALGNIVERDRCLQLCSDIHTELMKDLLEVASATVWIQKDKFSIESMASS